MNANDVVLETGEIDWGDVGNADIPAEIDFNISLEDSGIKVEGSGLSGGIAKGEEALTLLDSPSHRDQFLDEIFEVGLIYCKIFVQKRAKLICSFDSIVCSWKHF